MQIRCKVCGRLQFPFISLGFFNGKCLSCTELEEWAASNIQPEKQYLGETFRSALVVQQIGLGDGYLISVMYIVLS